MVNTCTHLGKLFVFVYISKLPMYRTMHLWYRSAWGIQLSNRICLLWSQSVYNMLQDNCRSLIGLLCTGIITKIWSERRFQIFYREIDSVDESNAVYRQATLGNARHVLKVCLVRIDWNECFNNPLVRILKQHCVDYKSHHNSQKKLGPIIQSDADSGPWSHKVNP